MRLPSLLGGLNSRSVPRLLRLIGDAQFGFDPFLPPKTTPDFEKFFHDRAQQAPLFEGGFCGRRE